MPTSNNDAVLQLEPAITGNQRTLQISITISDMKYGCDTTFQRFVNVIPLPAINWSASDVCLGETMYFNNNSSGGGSWYWELGNGSTSLNQYPAITYTEAGKYRVKLVMKNALGCEDSLIKTVTVNPVPVVDFKAPVQLCLGEKFVPENASVFDTALKYTWEMGDGNTVSDSSPVYNFTKAGKYAVKLTAVTNTGCSNSVTRSIVIYDKPNADFTIQDTICAGQNFTVKNKSIFSSNYIWAFSSGDTFTVNEPAFALSVPGNYHVKLIASNANGCSDTLTRNFEIIDLPVAEFEAGSVCLGDSMKFINKSNIRGAKSVSYWWNFGDGKTSTLEHPFHLYPKEGNYTVTLRITGTGGCIDSARHEVLVGGQPVTIFAFMHGCANTTITFTDLITVSNTKIVARHWDFGNGNFSTDSIPQYIFTKAGKYPVSLKITTNLGCESIFTDTVTVYELPKAGFSNDTVCMNSATNFINKSSGNMNSFWYFGDGDSSASNSPSHTYKTSGKYEALLVVKSLYGCTDSFKQTVLVSALPVATFNFSISGRNVSFVPGDTSVVSYAWDFGDGKTSSLKYPVHKYDSNGNYTVTLHILNSNGCTDSVSRQVTINAVGTTEIEILSEKIEVFPNPFQSEFTVRYRLHKPSQVRLLMQNSEGKSVYTAKLGIQNSGEYKETVKPVLAAGTYMLYIIIDDKIFAKKIIYVK